MTVTPTPTDPETSQPPQRLLGFRFWVSIAFAILCVAAGAAIAVYAPRLLPKSQNHDKPFGLNTAKRLIGGSFPPVPDATPIVPVSPDQLHVTVTARQALTAAQLLQSGRTTRPFRADWVRLDAMAPGNPDIAALRDLASVGAPSPTALAQEFPSYASKAVAAARAAGPGANVWSRIRALFLRLVTVRRIDDLNGNGLDAALARAESGLKDGNVEEALHALEVLDSRARSALEPWLSRARARTEIDRRVAALQGRALQDVSHIPGSVQ